MSQIRVVLTDDNPVFRQGLRKLLESASDVVVVGEAGDGLAVVELVRTCPVDLVLMDIRMPGQDGLAAARQIRTQCPDVRVLVLTSYDTPTLRAEAKTAEVSTYLLKSVGADELLANIRTAVYPRKENRNGL